MGKEKPFRSLWQVPRWKMMEQLEQIAKQKSVQPKDLISRISANILEKANLVQRDRFGNYLLAPDGILVMRYWNRIPEESHRLNRSSKKRKKHTMKCSMTTCIEEATEKISYTLPRVDLLNGFNLWDQAEIEIDVCEKCLEKILKTQPQNVSMGCHIIEPKKDK